MKTTIKLFLTLSLVGLFLAFVRTVFALELNYPDLPGLGALKEGHELGWYVKYFFNLAFFIAAGVSIITISVGGFLYITRSYKTSTIIQAREYIKNGLLGLLIITLSWSFLYVINPNLLLFNIEIKQVGPARSYTGLPYKASDVVAQEVPVLDIAERIVDSLGEEVYLDLNNRYYEQIGKDACLTDGFVNLVDKNGFISEDCVKASLGGAGPLTFIHRAAIPLKNIETLLGEAETITIELVELLKDCQCGQSTYHLETSWEGGSCVPGVSDSVWENFANDEVYPEDEKMRGKNLCKTQCGENDNKIGKNTCGDQLKGDGYPMCDLRQTRINVQTVEVKKGGEIKERPIQIMEVMIEDSSGKLAWRYFNWQAVGWDPPGGFENNTIKTLDLDGQPGFDFTPYNERKDKAKVNPDRLIKYKVMQLVEIRAKLEGEKQKFFPEQTNLVTKSLVTHKFAFLLDKIDNGGFFNYDFQDYATELEAKGYNVIIQPFIKQSGQTDFALTRSNQGNLWDNLFALVTPPVSALTKLGKYTFKQTPGTFYYIFHAPNTVLPKELTEYNKEVHLESARFSLFSLLTGLTLEQIEAIFKGCLAIANADYTLSKEDLRKILASSIIEGAAAHFEAVLDSKLAEMTRNALNSMGNKIRQDTEEEVIGRYMQSNNACKPNEHGCAGKTPADIAQEIREDNCKSTCCNCVNSFIKKGLPPRFISDTIIKAFEVKLKDVFPLISENLNKRMREVLFPKDGPIDEWLNKNMLEIWNAILNQAFVRTFVSMQDGFIQKILDKQMEDVLGELIANSLKDIDAYLDRTINGECRIVSNAKECVYEQFEETKLGEDTIRKCRTKKGGITKERIVDSKFRCRNEVFKERGPTKECCTMGLKQHISAYSEDLVWELLKEFVTEPIDQWTEGIIARRGLSDDYKSINECYTKLDQGRIFVYGTNKPGKWKPTKGTKEFSKVINMPGGLNMEKLSKLGYIEIARDLTADEAVEGECRELTVKEINALPDDIIYVPYREFIDVDGINILLNPDYRETEKRKVAFQGIGGAYKKTFCKANYEWMASTNISLQQGNLPGVIINSSDLEVTGGLSYKCVDRDNLTQDIVGAADAVKDYKGTAKDIAAAGFRWLTSLSTAFLETLTHTVIENAKVLIADYIVYPFQSSFDKVVDFQEGIGRFLKSSVAEVLPDQINSLLNSNIAEVTEKLCSQVRDKVSECRIAEDAGTEDPKISITLGLNLPTGVTYDNKSVITDDIDISCDLAEAFCKTSTHFKTTLFEEIVATDDGLKDFLNGQLIFHLERRFCPDKAEGTTGCIKEYLEQPLAQIFWPGIEGMTNLIKGTPKDIICGEIVGYRIEDGQISWGYPDSSVTQNGRQSVYSRCTTSGAKKLVGGILPTVDGSVFTDIERDSIIPSWCWFIYVGCQNPLVESPELKSTLGELIKLLFDRSCDWLSSDIGENSEVSVQCKGNFPTERVTDLEADSKYGCLACRDMNRPIKDVVLSWAEEAGLVGETVVEILQGVSGTTPKTALILVPLGIVKPFKSGEDTLLIKQSRETTNILNKSAFDILSMHCARVENDFTKTYPDYTMSALASKEWSDLAGALTYSVERTRTGSISKRLELIASLNINADINADLQKNYLFCQALKYSPAQIFGFDQELINYVKPEEFKVLFALMRNELRDDEKPENLKTILKYLYDYTPLKVLGEAINDWPDQDEKARVQEFKTFLETPLMTELRSALPLDKRMIDVICEQGPTGWCDKPLGEPILQKSVLQLIVDYLTQTAPGPWSDREMSLMNQLAKNNFIFGKPYIDSFGEIVGLDKALYKGVNVADKVTGIIDVVANRIVETAQSALEYVILEMPKDIAGMLGIGLGNKTSDQIAGLCYSSQPLAIGEEGPLQPINTKDDCRPGEVFRTRVDQVNECCSMGAPIVCQPRCRTCGSGGCDEKTSCDTGEEWKKGDTLAQDSCCVELVNQQCERCRKIKHSTGAKCRVNENGEPIEETKKIDDNYSLCCHKESYSGEETDTCCVTVMQCISNNLAEHLESLAEQLTDGEIRLNDLRFGNR